MNNQERHVRATNIQKVYDVSYVTLRRWAEDGKFDSNEQKAEERDSIESKTPAIEKKIQETSESDSIIEGEFSQESLS